MTLDQITKDAINKHLEDGEYNTPNEVVMAGLSLLDEQRKAKIKALRQAIQEGRDSGYIENFDWDEHRRKLEAEYLKNG